MSKRPSNPPPVPTSARPMPSMASPETKIGTPQIEATGYTGWQVARVGPAGKEAHIVRFRWSHPGQPFSNVTIELGYETGDHMIGILVLPPGLKPSDGVRLQIDDIEPSQKLPFAGFNPTGGLVALELKAEFVGTLRAGHRLNVSVHASSNGRKIIFAIPLAGFAAAEGHLKQIYSGAPA